MTDDKVLEAIDGILEALERFEGLQLSTVEAGLYDKIAYSATRMMEFHMGLPAGMLTKMVKE